MSFPFHWQLTTSRTEFFFISQHTTVKYNKLRMYLSLTKHNQYNSTFFDTTSIPYGTGTVPVPLFIIIISIPGTVQVRILPIRYRYHRLRNHRKIGDGLIFRIKRVEKLLRFGTVPYGTKVKTN